MATIFAAVIPISEAKNNIALDKSIYGLEETVKITLSNLTDEPIGESIGEIPGDDETNYESYSLSIISQNNIFRFSGELKSQLEFYVQEPGDYLVRLNNDKNELVDEASFTVLQYYVVNTNGIVSTPKNEYLVNEQVLIYINATGKYDLVINSEKESFRYLEIISSPLPFIPQSIGHYKIELRKNFKPIATTEFDVFDTAEQLTEQPSALSLPTENQSLAPTSNQTVQPAEEGTSADEIISSINNENNMPGIYHDNNSDYGNNPDNETPAPPKKSLPFKLSMNNKKGIQDQSNINVEVISENKSTGKYDLNIYPEKAGIRKIRINNLKSIANNKKATVNDNQSFELDEIKLKKEDVNKNFRGAKLINTFFIDASELNFSDGTITRRAAGKELWKCKEWNKTTEKCDGTWQKIMDLTPGTEYDIIINPEDPAYAETGVASINTKKPIYHPGETAEIIIVVLDNEGYLVSNANVQLTITAPDNITITTLTTSATSASQIIETSRGIYETQFLGMNTQQEGSYSLLVYANGKGVNNSMQSSFDVKSFYEFDIIRNTPVTIDPWKGPFLSSINIVSYINTSNDYHISNGSTNLIFDFTEVLPSEFLVTNLGGAEQRTTGNQTLLTWTNLQDNATIQYSALPPLITPNLYALGKSFISYVQGTMRIFTESRFWYLAIDPLINLFSETFESNWGCATTGSPAAGDNCTKTNWGNFNICNMPSTHRFCTSDDGQDGIGGNHTTYAIQMMNFLNWNSTRGLCYSFNPTIYDDINVSGYQASASLDSNAEFCRIWVYDSNSWTTIYQCVNNVPTGCEAGDSTPQSNNYVFFQASLSSLAGINLSESNISVCIGANQSGTINDYCFWDRINITGITNPPNITNLSYPANGSTKDNFPLQFNFTVTDKHDSIIPNCTLMTNFTGNWEANKTVDNVTNNTITNITLESIPDGTYLWNVICQDTSNLTDDYDYNFTVKIDAWPPRKNVTNVSEDNSAPWATIDRTPSVIISLNENGSCRMSLTNESYADMSNDYNCTGNGTLTSNCTYNGPELPIGDNVTYIACNDTTGHADNASTNLAVNIDILCDAHNDCDSTYYCDYQQNCVIDVLSGYSCENRAYGDEEDNEVCGNGTNSYCINDSTYIYTGWYCTADANDCVYNDNAHSYDLNYKLCNDTSNDYKNCSASNQWSAWTLCAEQYEAYNQSATYHAAGYCGYYASAQTCTSGSIPSAGCTGSPTDCNPYIYNQTTNNCGAVSAACDIGCGAGCDPGNSTTPGIISGTCYYDKTCSNLCAWSQSTELAPTFCINDNDGGACAYTTRTNPGSAETCYWNIVCEDTTGASLTQGTADNLRADYCDYCNATSNQSGQYSPAPNASCSSSCADSGTIYYDSELTPLDRSNDCNGNGISTIISDSVNPGDIWNGSASAHCDATECSLDCGTLTGACNITTTVCECTDTDYPELIIMLPNPNTWDNDGTIIFTYSVNDTSSGIQNCSLIINGSVNMTNSTINESVAEQTFAKTLVNGTYNWSIRCFDNSSQHNMNQSEGRIIGVDTILPSISNPLRSGTSFSVNQQICLNVSASDTIPSSGLSRVYALISLPEGGTEEVDLSDSSTTTCDSSNGNGIYSAQYSLVFSGTYTWTYAYAIDNAANENNAAASLGWNVTAGGNITANMTAPTSNITINESEANYYYNQNCSVICQSGKNCKDVFLFPQYYENGDWQRMDLSTALFPDALNYSCGNLSSQGSATWWNSSWQYRKKISIVNNNNTNSLPANYSLRISVNTTNPAMLSNGNDVRVVYWNGTNNTEIDRINTTAFNSISTYLWFKIQKDISAGATDTSYYIYYGNSGAVAAPQNKTKVYDFWDDFSNNLAQWTIDSENTDAVTASASLGNPAPSLRHDPDSTQTKSAYYDTRLQTTSYRFQDGIIEYDMYVSGTARSIHQFGFRVPNLNFTNGYAWRLQSSSSDGGWFELTGRTSWTTFGTAYPAVTTGTWHHVILNISGANYNATVDGGSIYSGTDSTKLTADYLVSHVHATGTDYYVLVDNIQARKTMSPAPSATSQEEESPPINNFSCSHTFNITSRPDAGNNTHPIRCEAISSNSPTDFSNSRNVTINDHPVASILYPENNTWVARTINLNASTSTDSDGSITNYLFEYDNNTAFTSPGTLCNGASSNCTWNTSQNQNQCQNNTIACYIKVTVQDNNGLTNNTYITVGFDTNAPTTTLDLPRNSENITSNTFTANATSIDGESGVHTVFFEYRENSSTTWKSACNLTTQPYECVWNLTNLADGNTYEFRTYANDSVGNIGGADAHTGITVDRAAPVINLENPPDNNYTTDTTIIFSYNANDSTSNIANCSLILDGSIQDTNFSVQEGISQSFTSVLSEGFHNWSINCADNLGNQNNSETRNITIDLTGPVTTLNLPANYENITGTITYSVSATATDAGIGNISLVTFEYREGDSEEWIFACSDDRGPAYECDWDLSGLSDSNDYQLRAWANDTLGNNGTYDTRTGITIDNNPPQITLISPPDDSTDGDGILLFKYSANDIAAEVSNCSLIWNNILNQTEPGPITEEQEYQFQLSNITNGNYTWSINCTDSFGQKKASETRNITIDIRFIMYVNVTSDENQYEIGNQEGEDANITTNITDYLGGPIPSVNTTNDIVRIYNLTERIIPWWNTSWAKRKAIYVSNTYSTNQTNITVIVNVTGLDGNITNCENEIRITSLNSRETPVNIIAGDNSNYCEVAFKANITAGSSNENKYFVYYNNSGASNPGYATFPVYTYDTFQPTNIGDSYVSNSAVGTNYGTATNLNIRSRTTIRQRTYIKFNLSAMPSYVEGISQATLCLYLYLNQATPNASVYHVYDDTWTERGITYTNQPCGGDAFNNATNCNLTAEELKVTGATGWICWNVSKMTSAEYATGDRNINIVLKSEELGSNAVDSYYSRNYTTNTALRPYMNITGYSNQAQNISETHTGNSQEWVTRNTSTTDNDGIWKRIFRTFNSTLGNYSTVSLGQKNNYTDTYNNTFFEIIDDKTPPDITLNTPENLTEANSSVTFTYYVNDSLSTIGNCSLIIDTNVEKTEYAIFEGPVQNFYPRIPIGGWHNWSVNCTDTYGNTGASEKWLIYIKPPDLAINSGNITFNNTAPKEGDNVSINFTAYNLGGSDATNVIMQIWLGDPDNEGTQLGSNFSANITEVTGNISNASFNISWIASGPGPFNFFIVADPPTGINGSIFELNETNNKANKTIHVPAYNYFYGNVENNIYLGNADNDSLYYYLDITNVSGNVFVTDAENNINFALLQAISRDTSDSFAPNDFNETDAKLNMSNYNDSIRQDYTGNTDTPINTKTFTIQGQTISNVPIVNSTNVSNFVTGILWDMSDGGTQYNGTQDIVFVTEINEEQQGAYGIYDYEIKVPVNLKNYILPGNSVEFYWEITESRAP